MSLYDNENDYEEDEDQENDGSEQPSVNNYEKNEEENTPSPSPKKGGINLAKIKADIAQVESRGRYNATSKKSTAAGKYQFIWSQWGKQIAQLTGVKSKQQFLANPQAQEDFMDHYLVNQVLPRVKILRQEGLGNNLSDSDLAKIIHLEGYAGAKRKLASGQLNVASKNNLSPLQYLKRSQSSVIPPVRPPKNADMDYMDMMDDENDANNQKEQMSNVVGSTVYGQAHTPTSEEQQTLLPPNLYYQLKNNRSDKPYADGSWITDGDSPLSKGIGAGAGLLAGFLPPDDSANTGKVNYGSKIGTGALSGASAGAEFGPIGAAAGAVLGGVTGLIGANREQKTLTEAGVKNSRKMSNNINTRATSVDNDPYGLQMAMGSFVYNMGGELDSQPGGTKNSKTKPSNNSTIQVPLKNNTFYNNKKELANMYNQASKNLDGLDKQTMELKGQGLLHPNDLRITPQYSMNGTENNFYRSAGPTAVIPSKPGMNSNPNWRNTPTKMGSNGEYVIDNSPYAFGMGGQFTNPFKFDMGGENEAVSEGENEGANYIDIEKGELRIDPKSGKILQEYSGLNPLSGTKYEKHAKNIDIEPAGNFVKATPGEFIITRKDAKKYKLADKNNDTILKGSIMRNIIANKNKKEEGNYKRGSYIVPKYDMGGNTTSSPTGYPASANTDVPFDFLTNSPLLNSPSVPAPFTYQGWVNHDVMSRVKPVVGDLPAHAPLHPVQGYDPGIMKQLIKQHQNTNFADGGPYLDSSDPELPTVTVNGGKSDRNSYSKSIPVNSIYNPSPNLPIPNVVNGNIPQDNTPLKFKSAPSDSLSFGQIADHISKITPALYNIGQGLYADKEKQIAPEYNPYEGQVIGNMPQNVNFENIRQQYLLNAQGQYNDIDQRSNSSSVGRANKNNVYANTLNQLGNAQFQANQYNNQNASTRAGLYNQLGNQRVNANNIANQYNYRINDDNARNQGAARNSIGTGLSQIIASNLNDKQNALKAQYDQAILNHVYNHLGAVYGLHSNDYVTPFLAQ